MMFSVDTVKQISLNYLSNRDFQCREMECSAIVLDRLTDISYEKFFFDYLLRNRPCLLSSSATQHWRSRKEWVTEDGKPNLKYMSQCFGMCLGSKVVPVANCEVREYNSQQKHHMLFSEYVDYWISLNQHDQENLPCLYLKDWHFNRANPNYKAYETPEYFTSDWLNEFCENQDDDYQFVYMGPKNSWTPLHVDVFGSFSWSANVCGKKKWLLFPPGTEKQLCDGTNEVIYSVDDLPYSLGIEVIQEAGEVIFVPSGWYHQVWNLDDVISINHNWFNGCNINHIWKSLREAEENVKEEISDLKDIEDWEEKCQAILKIHHGIHCGDLLDMLKYISIRRLDVLNIDQENSNYWHWVFDLINIRNVITIMIQSNLPLDIVSDAKCLLEKVTNFLDSVQHLEL